MKKFIYAAFIAAMMCACSSTNEPKPAVVEYVNRLVETYPNYRNNDIAKSALLDSIANHVRPVGQPATDIDGVRFKFAKLIDNPQTGEKSAVFTSFGLMSSIDNPNGNPKYLMTDINMRVLGNVDDETAAKLDANREYEISGVLRAWDADDVFFVTHSVGYSVDFGTYILDNMKINPVE